jgi:phosphoribosylamine---glycine ligase
MFPNLKAARDRAMKVNEPLVFKTMGDGADKSMTYVARDPADMVARIDRWIKSGVKVKGECMLQQKIEGYEMGISCWFGPDGPLNEKWNINFEHKKLMPGNYGPNTGEMGTVIQYVKEDKITEVYTPELVKAFIEAGHTGDLDLNCMIDKKGEIWPMEFTCRPGWPYDWISDALIHSDPAQWRRDLLDGKDTLDLEYACSIGEVVAVPPFPYDVKKNSVDPMGLMIETPDDWTGIHPVCMMIEEGPAMDGEKVVMRPVAKSSGDYVMVLTGVGSTVVEAQDEVRRVRDQVHVSNMIIRNDIGDNLEKCLPKLQKLGFATEMEYGK